VTVETAISVPSSLVSNFESPFSVFLNGKGTVSHVINGFGEATKESVNNTGAYPSWFCEESNVVADRSKTVVYPFEFCPSSPEEVHAQASVDFVTHAQCSDVSEEILARIANNEAGSWTDPHNGGHYALVGATSDIHGFHRIEANRVTGTGDPDSPVVGPFTDKIRFTLQQRGRGAHCEITACSVSQSKSVTDFSANYCNQRNLYCGSAAGCTSVKHDFSFHETNITLSPSRSGYPGASAEPEKCIVPTSSVV